MAVFVCRSNTKSRRSACVAALLGRTRLVPWHAIRAYQLRPTGIVLYQRSDPGNFDLLRSMFVPYPPDADELLVRHATVCVARD